MADYQWTPELFELLAKRFRALAEPARLKILNCLRAGERTVTEIMDEAQLSQANASKHLQLLHNLGFVERRKEGLYVYYALADDQVFRICGIMCGRIAQEADARSLLLRPGAGRIGPEKR